MGNSEQLQYLPDYLVSPGDVLADYLDFLGMSQADLSTRSGLSTKTINEIIKGKSPITCDTALRFERVLGRPAHFWNELQCNYQTECTRLANSATLKANLEWLRAVPVAAMARLGFIHKQKTDVENLEAVLSFFGIASPEQWEDVFSQYQPAFRKTERVECDPLAISAWLRKGELDALKISCAAFDKELFREALTEIRRLTKEAPEVFCPRLTELCASAGVATVFVPELPKTGVYGATRWIGGKAIIQLSLRYKSNDHLWFTFFHEAGHILKHGRKDVFLEGKCLDKEKETEANTFAGDFLIPRSAYNRFLLTWDTRSLEDIRQFAREIEIATGIVVGRLQHDKRLSNSVGNKEKVFYCR